ncbi:hypothetical protein CKO15_09125 [Halorhodospira abdelmalekii]|uniref:urea ABC transporter substrate-binding protein n=1 Tax=Halorhodospira abdelmalekii TaxID=421629 RepID=UPI001904A436|nr:urea ABC transporter substrate-binding protein [Halorhodospira abdelmalekii]MBK1735441.1 hypothetical protein [Halorhodospira abdelmalekii]
MPIKTLNAVGRLTHGRWALVGIAAVLAIGLGAVMVGVLHTGEERKTEPIPIGVIYSLTGNMAVSEAPLIQAVTLAVEEINSAGGLLGRPVELMTVDGRSDPQHTAAEAERLIVDGQIAALFACWTSACRQAVKPVVERHHHLLFYALQYEGLEQSPHIIYGGHAPNQQIIPGTRWALERWGHRVYLIGSDYIFPRTAHFIIRDLVRAEAAEVVGERYVPLGHDRMEAVIEDLERLRPDFIINTVNGISNLYLLDALHAAGFSDLPLLSFSVSESDLTAMEAVHHPRHYAVWGYFQSLDTPLNREFVERFQRRFGADRPISSPMESAYTNVHLWAQAVAAAGSAQPARVNHSLMLQSRRAPSGIVTIDPATRHQWRTFYIGQAQEDGQFEIVAAMEQPIRPAPFPSYRSVATWQRIAQEIAYELQQGSTP